MKILRQHSGGSAARVFECSEGSASVLAKVATCKAGRKLLLESEWLQTYGGLFATPKVLGLRKKGLVVRLEMEFINNATSLEFLGAELSPIDSITLLLDILKKTERLPPQTRSESLSDQIDNCWSNYIFGKVENIPDICFSGILHSMDKVMQRLEESYRREPLPRIPIHGDLTTENILLDSSGWHLIDPNPRNIFSDLAVETGKMYQSYHGQYEQIREAVKTSWKKCPHKTSVFERLEMELLARKGPEFIVKVRAHEILHFFRLLPYRHRSEPDLIPLFVERIECLIQEFLELK